VLELKDVDQPATATSSWASARQLNTSSDLAEMTALAIVLIGADVSRPYGGRRLLVSWRGLPPLGR
jgi:hypothetical protein